MKHPMEINWYGIPDTTQMALAMRKRPKCTRGKEDDATLNIEDT
jgi:hypothetical protein